MTWSGPTYRFTVSLHLVGSNFSRVQHDHFDWFFQTQADETAALCTVATGLNVATTMPEGITADLLPDHRGIYLDFDGPFSDDRGEIIRMMTGTFQWERKTPDSMAVSLQSVETQSFSRQNWGAEVQAAVQTVVQTGHEWSKQIQCGKLPTLKFQLIPQNTRD